jgi:transcription elongation factor GreA
MPERLMLTPEGREKLRAELEHLRNVRRKEAVERLQAARELSDAWDSPEYIEAKNEMSFIEGRIITIERMLAEAGIIPTDRPAGATDFVRLGCKVTVVNEDGEEETYILVGSAEADPRLGRISNQSPVGQALLGRRVGERVQVVAPGGMRELTVRSIS